LTSTGAASPGGAGSPFLRSFFSLGAGELLSRVVAFVVAIYLSRVLGAESYGILSFALAVMLYLQRVAGWELESIGITEVLGDERDARRIASGLLMFRVLVAVALAVLGWLVAYLALPRTDAQAISLYALALLPFALNPRWLHLMHHRAQWPARSRVVTELTSALIIVSFVRSPRDLLLVPLAQLAGEILGTAWSMWPAIQRRELGTLGLNWDVVGPIAARAVPLVLYALLGLVVFNVDLIILRLTRSAAEAGFYAAAYALVGLLVNLGFAYFASLVPVFSRLREKPGELRTIYDRAYGFALLALLPVVVGGVIVAPAIISTILGETYAPAAEPLRLLLVTTGLTVGRFVPLAGLSSIGHRRQMLVINGIGAAINIALNLYFIPRYGILGAAWCTVTTDVLRFALALVFAHQAGFGFAAFARAWRALAAVTLMGLVVWFAVPGGLWVAVGTGAIVYVIALVAVRAVRIERRGGLAFDV
jgi:O-antigen/teichoic acid export membrane protein